MSSCTELYFLSLGNSLKNTVGKKKKSMGTNSNYKLTINYVFCLNKLIICCLLLSSKVVVKFRYGV